jgi:hypothetical protein
MGIGQNCPKTPPISPYLGTTAGESMARLLLNYKGEFRLGSIRIVIGLITLIVAGFVIFLGMHGSLSGKWPDLLLNLGTEMFGIVLTVLIVDWLFEQREIRQEAKRLAIGFLNRLDHHVWVWQGGARDFNLTETLTMLRYVTNDDPLPEFTQNLLLVLGSNAADRSRYDSEVVAANKYLKQGFDKLQKLTDIRRDYQRTMSSTDIAKHLSEAAMALAKAAELSIPKIDGNERPEYRNPSIEYQEWRHYGGTQPDRPLNPSVG